MSSETSSVPQPDDAEAKMRQSLGLDKASGPGSVPSSPNDPLRGARQAIRSQAIAREYVERQLVHAESTNQDLRAKLHHSRKDKDAAIEAARLATARKVNAERTLITTEAALTTEKVARDRSDRALREAQATVRDLQSRLDAVAQGLETAKADLAAERQARQKAEDALREAQGTPQIATPDNRDEAAVLTIGRPVGRPRKVVPVQPVNEAGASVEASKPPVAEAITAAAVVPPARRSVGRPRKPVQPKPTSSKAAAVPETLGKKAGRLRQTVGEQEPVQWWVDGWDRRGR